MSESILKNLGSFIIVICLLLAGCGAARVLESKSAEVPVGVDLSGFWVIRDDPNAPRISDNRRVRDGLIPTGNMSRTRRNRDSSSVSVQVFLEYGESLKITQTQYGIFISYDRSIVEEYTFGENRLVTIGPIEALRVSGWDGHSFVVETLDDGGTMLFEVWHLQDGNDVLVRHIRMTKGDHETFSQEQVFDRR